MKANDAKKQLVSQSVSDEFRHALVEWRHDGLCQNLEKRIAICALSRERLRFAFSIVNVRNKRHLWVGLPAILKLRIPIYDRDERVAPHKVKSHLSALVQRLVNEEAIGRCVMSSMMKCNEPLAHALVQYSKYGGLSPYEASLIFHAIEDAGIMTADVLLPIFLRREEDIDQLRAIPSWSLWRFWHCLTNEQISIALACNQVPPSTRHKALVQYNRDAQLSSDSDECANLLRE